MRFSPIFSFGLISTALFFGCGDDDDGGGSGETNDAGSSGKAGSAGSAGSGGDAAATGDGGDSSSTGGTSGAADNGGGGGAIAEATDVTGKVVDQYLRPLANVPVIVNGETAATNADGEFTVPDVDETYDCVLIVSDRKLAYQFTDLTRRDPTLQLYHVHSEGTPPYSAYLAVDLTVGGGPATAEETRLAVDIKRFDATRQVSEIGDPFVPYWRESTEISADLYALAFDDARSLFAYGKKAITLTDGGYPTESVELTELDVADLNVTVTAPAGYTPDYAEEYLSLSEGAFVEVVTDEAAGEEFVLPSPDVPDGELLISSRAVTTSFVPYNRAYARVAPGTEAVTLEHRAAAAPLLPVDAATGVTDATKFQYTESEGAVYVVVIQPKSADDPTYVVVTSRTSVTVPDVSDVGLGLPSGVDYRWYVRTVGPYDDVDQAAGEDGYASVIKLMDYSGFVDEHMPARATLGVSSMREFTVAP